MENEQEKPANAMVGPASESQGEHWLADFGPVLNPVIWTNIPQDHPDYGYLLMSARNKPTHVADDILGKDVKLSYVLLHPVQMVHKDTGEIQDLVRAVFILDNLDTVAFVSGGILRALQMIFMGYGRGPWTPPLPVQIRQIKLDGGKRTFEVHVPRGYRPEKKGGKK